MVLKICSIEICRVDGKSEAGRAVKYANGCPMMMTLM